MISITILVANLLVIGVSSYLTWRIDKHKIFWWALIFKLMCGVSVGLLYKYYYRTGDTWTFFEESKTVNELVSSDPGKLINFFWNDALPSPVPEVDDRPRSLFFLKLVSAFNLIDNNNYWITSLYFSLISFLGSWYLVRILSRHFPALTTEIIISFLFVPSAVLWGSGIIKESISIGLLFLVTAFFVNGYFERRVSIIKIIVALFSFWILWGLKYYWLAAWLAVVIPIVIVLLLKPKVPWVTDHSKLTWLLLLIVSGVGISVIHPNFYYYRFFSVISENYYAYLSLSQPEDVIRYYNLDSNLSSIVINAPLALLSGLFRPFIFEAHNILQTAAGLENAVLLLLFAVAVFRFRDYKRMDILTLAVIFYIILLSIFLALSTPNFGTLSRYKIAFTPFFWFGLLSASQVVNRFRKSS